MELKAAMFDLDGTLLDTLDDLTFTMQSVLETEGYPTIDRETVRHYIGNGAMQFLRLSLPPHARNPESIDKYLAVYHNEYEKNKNRHTKPFKGVYGMLKAFNLGNIPVAVISNKPHDDTVAVINHFFPDINFKAVLGQKTDFPPKPDPASAYYIADKLGYKPSEIAFIGDGDADARTANAGGFYQVSVMWGYRNRAELEAAGAKRFVYGTGEILQLFNIASEE